MASRKAEKEWTLESYAAHNDELAKKYPEVDSARQARTARNHLIEARNLLRIRCTDSAVSSLIEAVDLLVPAS